MDELIKRSDAKDAVIKQQGLYGAVVDDICERIESIPSVDRPQGEVDAIDRDALIDYCLKLIDVERKQGSDVMNYGQERVNQTEAIIDYIEHMPHIKANRTQGEWKDRTYGGRILHPWWESCECSQCEEWGSGAWNYCPHCGARMKGADDDQDI